MTKAEAARLGGLARAKLLSPERRQEIARMGGRTSYRKDREWLARLPKEIPVPDGAPGTPSSSEVSLEEAFERAKASLVRIFDDPEAPPRLVIAAARIIYRARQRELGKLRA